MPIVRYGENGKIKEVTGVYQPKLIDVLKEAGELFIVVSDENVSTSNHFVRDGFVTIRPDLQLNINKTRIKPDGEDAARVTGLPDPCTLFLIDEMGDVQEHVIEGGTLEFTVENEGRYSLTFEAWPYMPKTIEISTVKPPKGSENAPDMWEAEDENHEA